MEPRRPGTNPLIETKTEAETKVDKAKRYREIIEILNESGNPMSAKEIAIVMWVKGYTPTSERNFASPRLTELLREGKVEVVGKKLCNYSKKMVGVFKLKGEKI